MPTRATRPPAIGGPIKVTGSYGHSVLSAKEFAPATEDLVLPGSGLEVAAGTVAGVRRTFTTTSAEGVPFLDIVNEQTVALGLGAHWRQEVDQPNWTVEIDGDPSIRCELAVGPGSDPGQDPVTALNAARAVNFIREVVAAPPGLVSVLDAPAPRGQVAG